MQTSFLGGALPPAFQGRADHPKYKTGLAVCLNALPVEQGSWTRRPGTRTAATTRAGAYARLIDFDFSQNAPYTAEFTDSHLRFFSTYSLVHTYDMQTVSDISTANPAVVTQSGDGLWSDGDMVEFTIDHTLYPEDAALLSGRQFQISSAGGFTFDLNDPITGLSIDGSTLNITAGTPITVQRVLDLATPYRLPQLQDIRGVQALNKTTNTLVLLHGQVAPQALISTDPPQPVFALNPAVFTDGPYLDPATDGISVTPSGTSGSITLTASAPKFAATDKGRFVRLLSQPADWAVGTTYTAGENVTYQNAYYVALQTTTGNIPGSDAVNWGVATNVSAWVWGIITAFTDNENVTVALQVVNTATTNLPGVLVNTNAIPDANWRFGMFSPATGEPTCGCYHEGRLWLSGVLGNRIDGSVPNDIFNFSPTLVDGTVTDANAISYTFNSQDINAVFWMTPAMSGIICGTQAGEWVVSASAQNDVLTPTSIQAHRVTKYGSTNIEPVYAPFATLFVERNSRKLFEYLSDVFSGKMAGINVSLTGSNLSTSGIAEIKYQKELAPVLWARMNDGSLAGMTYRRDSPMLSTEATFSGWHSHTLGSGRTVTSLSVGPSMGGDLDALSMVTFDKATGIYWVELMTDIFPDDGTNQDAWFVDGGTVPAGSLISGTNLILYGLTYLDGETVSVYVAGVDAGDYVVSGGEVTVPLTGLLTQATIAAANDKSLIGSPTALSVSYASAAYPSGTIFIQSYIGPTTPVTGVSEDYILIDVPNNRVFEFSQGNNSTNGIRVLDLTSGLQINQATHDQIYGPGNPNDVIAPYALGYDGYLYTVNGTSNSTQFLKIDPKTLKIVARVGQNNSNLNAPPLDNNSIPFPGNLAAARVGDKTFVVAPSLSNVPHCISVLEMTDGVEQFASHAFTITEDFGLSCQTFDGLGVVYTLGKKSGITTSALGLYETNILEAASGFDPGRYWGSAGVDANPAITTARLGSIAATDIDATWTHISAVTSPVIDYSDANLMFFVQTTDSVTNKQYLVKIAPTLNPTVLWATPVDSIPSDPKGMAQSYPAFYKFRFLSGAPESGGVFLYTFNTSTGAATTATVPTLSATTASIYDGRLDATFNNGSFTQGVGSPTLLNSTPTSFTDQWFALSLAPGRQFYIVPACVGFTFTSQGQLLRPLAPQDTGARNGPALGKTRRDHRFAFLFLNTAGVSVGTTFSKLHAALFTSPGGIKYAANQLFSGVWSNPLEDNNSYEGQLCWQATRPYPVNVLAAQPFLVTQDR